MLGDQGSLQAPGSGIPQSPLPIRAHLPFSCPLQIPASGPLAAELGFSAHPPPPLLHRLFPASHAHTHAHSHSALTLFGSYSEALSKACCRPAAVALGVPPGGCAPSLPVPHGPGECRPAMNCAQKVLLAPAPCSGDQYCLHSIYEDPRPRHWETEARALAVSHRVIGPSLRRG